MTDDFPPFAARMRALGQPELAIRTFEHYYRQLHSGATGLLAEAELEPIRALPDAETDLGDHHASGHAALPHVVVIKLNGGLGTGMGMTGAKSLLPVKDGLTFLDLIARQLAALRRASGAHVPLVLMNSFRTREDSLAALARYPELATGLPLDFLQHRVPKVLASGLGPADHDDAELAWCPPGHGDLYSALVTSGMLAALRGRGLRWAFVSNSDNLGATVDTGILGYLVDHRLPFLMEVADRTEADKKGGHLARRKGGGLVLRESAQCAPEDHAAFQDWERHAYFNTNNLWLDLDALDALLLARDGVLGLPLIRNRKTLDPVDPASPAVYQLETAMGAAIEVFAGAGAVRVPRARFAPVKSTSDLLALWSDAYVRGADEQVALAPERGGAPVVVDLDPRFHGFIDDLERRFPRGAPSLIACQHLKVRGDVTFGAGVVCVGDVRVEAPPGLALQVPDGARLSGSWP